MGKFFKWYEPTPLKDAFYLALGLAVVVVAATILARVICLG